MSGEQALTMSPEGLRQFLSLKREAFEAVTARFYTTFPSLLVQFGEQGRQATREDLGYHLEFLQPVIELGVLQPVIDYLRWLKSILGSRNVPASYLPLSLDWFAEFFSTHLPAEDAAIMVRETGSKLVGLSVSLPRHFSAARETIHQLAAQGGAGRPRIMLGGVAINQFAPLASLLGADSGPSDAKETVRSASQLLELT
jgi:hypothetical protein